MEIISQNADVLKCIAIYNQLIYELAPKRKFIQMYHVINFFKGITLPLCLLLIYATSNVSARACLYAALHGSYGIVWVLKDTIFPDRSFRVRLTLGSCLLAAAFLFMYLLMGIYTIAM